jgi:hypothetical protein
MFLLHCASAKNDSVAALTEDGIRIIDFSSENPTAIHFPSYGSAAAAALMGNTVVISDHRGAILIYDIRSNRQPTSIRKVNENVLCMAASRNGSYAMGTVDGKVVVLRGAPSEIKEQAMCRGSHRSPYCSMDYRGDLVIAGSLDGRISVFNTALQQSASADLSIGSFPEETNVAATFRWKVQAVATNRKYAWCGFVSPLHTHSFVGLISIT